ncbi:MAG: lipoprotein B transmembrane [Piscirickettsiaceae bacterium]|nr:MAG: lipoprotein B transmembrane [Piscirickettsiaceae bacterium]
MIKNQHQSILYQLLRLTLLSVLIVSLFSCGFKLRGAIDLPENLQKIFIEGSQSSELVLDLKESLAYSAQVVTDKADADAILTISREETKNRTLSVDSNGKIREAELQYSVVYSLTTPKGDIILNNETLLLVRDYINDENDVIGRSNESAVITRDLKRDAAQQILRRLQALNGQ